MALGGISGTTHSGTKKCRFLHAELCIFLTSHLEGSQILLSDGSRQDSTLSRLLHDIQILLLLLLAAISCILFYLFLPGTCRCHKCPTQMPASGLPQWMWGAKKSDQKGIFSGSSFCISILWVQIATFCSPACSSPHWEILLKQTVSERCILRDYSEARSDKDKARETAKGYRRPKNSKRVLCSASAWPPNFPLCLPCQSTILIHTSNVCLGVKSMQGERIQYILLQNM